MHFLVLGPLKVIVQGREGWRCAAAKHRALLAALLVRANQAVSAEGLIDALWEGRPPAYHGKTSRTCVQLRRELEPTAVAGHWLALRTAEGGYRLVPQRRGQPGLRPLRAAGRGGKAGALAADRLAPPRGCAKGSRCGAGRLWRPGRRPVRPWRGGQAGISLVAVEWRIEAELALGGAAGLVGELEDLVGQEAVPGAAVGGLMLAHCAPQGESEALSAYRRFRGNLADQLGIEPGPDLRRLEEQILRQDPGLELVAPLAGPRDDTPRLPPGLATPPKSPLCWPRRGIGGLRRAWEKGKTAGPGIVVVSGEPGIGKSSSLPSSQSWCSPMAARSSSDADEEPLAPYQPFVETLGQHEGLAGVVGRLPRRSGSGWPCCCQQWCPPPWDPKAD